MHIHTRLLRQLISNLQSNITSEAIKAVWRLPCPGGGGTKMTVGYNMHMDTRVIEVAYFKYEAKCDFDNHCNCSPLVYMAIAHLFNN